MSALIFILILSFLVIIHELGHFVVARWAGIKVEEFGLGYPPKLLTVFKDKLGTIYTLNWLPFGGFVRLFGEDSVEATQGSFVSKPAWKRMAVILAGAAVNFLFGVLAFGAIYSWHGIPTNVAGAKIDGIAAGSPAEVAAVPRGVVVTGVDIGGTMTAVGSAKDLIDAVAAHRGETIELVIQEGQRYRVYVRRPDEVPEGQGALGVVLIDFEMKFYPWWQMPFRGMWVGLKSAVSFGGLILNALGSMVHELIFQGKVPADVAGPVGIVYQAEKEGFLRDGFWASLNFAAILSINLAIINVLPFPALDGGRGFFIAIEMIFRKRVKPKVEQWANSAGFLLLIMLIVLISARDIRRVLMDQGVQSWFSSLMGR